MIAGKAEARCFHLLLLGIIEGVNSVNPDGHQARSLSEGASLPKTLVSNMLRQTLQLGLRIAIKWVRGRQYAVELGRCPVEVCGQASA